MGTEKAKTSKLVMRQLVATLLISAVVGTLHGQTPTTPHSGSSATRISDQVNAIPLGSLVEVRFTGKKKNRGYLSKVESDSFSFKTGTAATSPLRQAVFSDVQSVRLVAPTHTPAWAWIATGAILGAVIIVVSVFLIAIHN